MDLDALADFNAVVRCGGFGPASRTTGQPKATLSRRVRALEASLGVRLIDRGGRALRLTEEGTTLHRRTSDLLTEIVDVGEELVGAAGAPRGRLRVSVPTLAASEALGRTCAAFVAAHPAVNLEIVADDRFVDPVADGFDIVLRANPPPDSSLVGQCIRSDTFVVAAHPSVSQPLVQDEPIPVPAVVLTRMPESEIWHVVTPSGTLPLRPLPKLRLSSMAMLRGAALCGAGAGLFPRRLIAEALANGDLVAWGDLPDRRVEVWALHASRRLASAKVRLFLEALRAAYAKPEH